MARSTTNTPAAMAIKTFPFILDDGIWRYRQLRANRVTFHLQYPLHNQGCRSLSSPNQYRYIVTKVTKLHGFAGGLLSPILARGIPSLVVRSAMKYASSMKTLTVQEASKNLGRWLRRAIGGEQIAIHEGTSAVLLQPLPASPEESASERLAAREALRRLQSQPRLTGAQAEAYLCEVRAERQTDGRRNGQ